MGAFLTAITISIFIMMGSALWILIWDVIDNIKINKKLSSVGLDRMLQQQIIEIIGSEDRKDIEEYVEDAVVNYLRET